MNTKYFVDCTYVVTSDCSLNASKYSMLILQALSGNLPVALILISFPSYLSLRSPCIYVAAVLTLKMNIGLLTLFLVGKGIVLKS